MHKRSTKQPPKPVLDSEQLQALVTDLSETKEGAIGGGGRKNWLVSNFKVNIDDIPKSIDVPITIRRPPH